MQASKHGGTWEVLQYDVYTKKKLITTEVNGYHQLFGFQHSSKYLLLYSTEERNTGLQQLEGE